MHFKQLHTTLKVTSLTFDFITKEINIFLKYVYMQIFMHTF